MGDGNQPTSEVVADRIRVNLNALKIGETRVTGSIGIATYPTINGRAEENVAELVERLCEL